MQGRTTKPTDITANIRPTNFLLSSCSLVSKNWNRQARTFIRDYRKCTIKNADEKTCERLHQLDLLCGKMTRAGRVFPFNSFKIDDSYAKGNCRKDPTKNGVIYKNLTAHFQLKYLEDASKEYKPRCPAYKQLVTWLRRDKSGQLKCLHIRRVELLKYVFHPDHHPDFRRLERIGISSCWDKSQRLKAKPVTLLENANNVKRIEVQETSGLEVVPEDKYELVRKFKFEYGSRSNTEDALFLKMLRRNLSPTELQVCVPRERSLSSGGTDAFRKALRQRSDDMLPRILRSCHQSLRTLKITGVYPIGQFPLMPMTNLSISNQNSDSRPNFEEFWGAIHGVNMPHVKEIEIRDHSGTLTSTWRSMQADAKKNDWPVSNKTNSRGASASSARKLKLAISDKRINMIPLRWLTPNIVSLELDVSQSWETEADIVPFLKIWELWPKLEVLKVAGGVNYLERNYDADFCGIHEEEAAFLREMGMDFLTAVHIVPAKPSVLTMLSKLFTCWCKARFSLPAFINE